MRSLVKNSYLVLLILLLTACGNQVIRPDKPQYEGLSLAQDYYHNRDYNRAADAYTQLYNIYHDDKFAIYAADSYLQLNQYQQAQQLLNNIGQNNNPLLALIRAELSIKQGNYDILLNDMQGELRPRYLQLKAKVNQYNNNHMVVALTLIELSALDEIAVNNTDIVNSLLKATDEQLTQALFNTDISELQQGWLEAAFIANSQEADSIREWRNRWADHPANAFFMLANSYNNISVLLPLSGRYKDISKSIQQGMIAAMYHNTSNQQNLTFFDTGSKGEHFSSAWYGAIESGAEFIIGPLEKRSIKQLTQMNSSTIPVMLLNKLDEEANPYGFYQFPLSQEDEVINVVSRLIAEDKKRILLLSPESTSGRKLAQLFESELTYQGGELVSYAFYPESTHDYSREINQVLGLDESVERSRQLKSIIATDFEFESQIRPDIDAIFILAKPNQARLLKPQLKFFKAENVPVFSTSQILSAKIDSTLDKDLNGIKFCQSAFIIDSQSLQEALDFDVSQITGYKKYFAMGFDAIGIYPKLEWMQTMQNQKLEGMSGNLSVDGNGKIHRELAWAQFKRGKPVLLPSIKRVIDDEIDNPDGTNNLDTLND